MSKITINKWPVSGLSGAKRAKIVESEWMDDWFVGHGKGESCQFEGTWWDMICFARNVLASENTKISAPSFYMPELKNDNYTGPTPYEYDKESNTAFDGSPRPITETGCDRQTTTDHKEAK